MLLSVMFVLAIFSFMTEYMNPLVQPLAARYRGGGEMTVSLGVASILIQTILWLGLVLFMLRRWSLPFGAVTFILTENAVGLSFIGNEIKVVSLDKLSQCL